MKDISVDRDDSLYLLSMSASNLCKTVTSKDIVVVESSKEKLEKGTRISLCAWKGDEMNKYSEKRIGSSATKLTTTEKSRDKTSSTPAEEVLFFFSYTSLLCRHWLLTLLPNH
ncbi:hypothetical protein Adt_38730 [Abeliophyllum distichum]|uniref:Uncharacterized protein n=1 Tax=Abeliophyllum distichum TaxID=126358 RepID=A0ABD1Q423_9LAMI